MTVFQALIKKETLQIVRDGRTVFVIFFIPILLLLLFGFAISTEINSIRVTAVAERHTAETRDILSRLAANPYIQFQGLSEAQEVDGELRRGETDAAVFLRIEEGEVKSQISVDASNPVVGRTATQYIGSIISGEKESPFIIHTLYNPQLLSSYNFVPGIMGMIFILICAMMTSVSIVREKETGTMSLLLVSPVRPGSIILGKLIPYFILSCGILGVILTLGYTVLGLPLSSSVWNVIWVSILYITLSLSIGLLVSTIVDTQLSALLVTAVLFMLPVIMLSGMIYPIDNMPRVIQGVSCIVPARWYVSAMRKLMVQHLELRYVIEEICVLGGMTVLILSAAIIKFRKR